LAVIARRRFVSIPALALLALASGRAGVAAPSDAAAAALAGTQDGVLTLLDYFDAGRLRAESFVERQGKDGGLSAALGRARQACVRIEVQYNQQGGNYQSFTASGVLVDGGRKVLTAGHVLAGVSDHSVRVTLTDGRSFPAQEVRSRYEVFASGSEDWGLLELQAPAGVALPAVPVAAPREGELAFVLGYPADFGVTPDGAVAPGIARTDAPLDPLTFVGRVHSESPLDLDPVAGCVPLGGASGAPVVNERGELLGVFVSVSQATSGGRVRHSYQAARVDAVGAGPAPRAAASAH
jgi:S1-C subfamily serine protease